MKKKKLLFVCYGLGIGGIEKCLINLVNYLDKTKYEITIATMNPEYNLLKYLDSSIDIIKFEEHFVNTSDFDKRFKYEQSLFKKMLLTLQYILYRVAIKLDINPWMFQKRLKNEYDYAIAYSHVGYVPQFVLDKVNAKNKILWYHTLWYDNKNIRFYSRFDKIVAVSRTASLNLKKVYPSLKDKIYVLYNLYNFEEIKELSLLNIDLFNENDLNIVTVARLSDEKGYELAIKSCYLLKNKTNIKFKWYWIGDGPDRILAMNLIKKLKLENEFILLGNKNNPYGYIRECDIYVQPSKREAFCTTIIEAITLKKPIIATDFKSIYEQLVNDENGWISKMDEKILSDKIKKLMENEKKRNYFSSNCDISSNYNLEMAKLYDELFE